MADPIYAATNIYYGREDDEVNFPKDRRTGKVIARIWVPGEVVDTKLFTKEVLAELLEAGSLSKIDVTKVEDPEITLDDLIADDPEPEPEPTKADPKVKP